MDKPSCKAAAAVLITASLGGCSVYEEHQFKHEAIDALKHSLSDPESAEFRGLRVVVREQIEFVLCGEINAKNRMGGYVGYRPFFVMALANDHERVVIQTEIAPATSLDETTESDGASLFEAHYASYCGQSPAK